MISHVYKQLGEHIEGIVSENDELKQENYTLKLKLQELERDHRQKQHEMKKAFRVQHKQHVLKYKKRIERLLGELQERGGVVEERVIKQELHNNITDDGMVIDIKDKPLKNIVNESRITPKLAPNFTPNFTPRFTPKFTPPTSKEDQGFVKPIIQNLERSPTKHNKSPTKISPTKKSPTKSTKEYLPFDKYENPNLIATQYSDETEPPSSQIKEPIRSSPIKTAHVHEYDQDLNHIDQKLKNSTILYKRQYLSNYYQHKFEHQPSFKIDLNANPITQSPWTINDFSRKFEITETPPYFYIKENTSQEDRYKHETFEAKLRSLINLRLKQIFTGETQFEVPVLNTFVQANRYTIDKKVLECITEDGDEINYIV